MKVVVITGPTACGKSDIGIKLAKKFNGEIISADSRQVYKKMDIGTGKVTGKTDLSYFLDIPPKLYPFISEGINHWLIDILNPSEQFSVADFQKYAEAIEQNIKERKKNPFIVGGTGFFIRSLTEGLLFPNAKVTEETKNYVESMTYEDALTKLLNLQNNAEEFIDIKNPRRVQRALSLLLSGMNNLSEMRMHKKPIAEYLVIGITYERETINQRILKRLDNRLNQGMVKEIELLLKNKDVTPERLDDFGLEYRWIGRFATGQITYNEMHEKLYTEICRFAKRQMTWFKKYCNVIWLNDEKQIIEMVDKFLKEI